MMALALTLMMDIEVRIGERESHYKVVETKKNELVLEFSNNAKERRQTPLKQHEYKELQMIVAQMNERGNDPRLCPKRFMKITTGKISKLACESGKDPLAVKMRKFIDLMRFLI